MSQFTFDELRKVQCRQQPFRGHVDNELARSKQCVRAQDVNPYISKQRRLRVSLVKLWNIVDPGIRVFGSRERLVQRSLIKTMSFTKE